MERDQILQELKKAYFSEEMHERPIIEHLPELLASATLFVDIGASLGHYTYFADKVMHGGEIITMVEVIEHFDNPVADFSRLSKYLAHNGIIAGTTDFYQGGAIWDNRYLVPKDHISDCYPIKQLL